MSGGIGYIKFKKGEKVFVFNPFLEDLKNGRDFRRLGIATFLKDKPVLTKSGKIHHWNYFFKFKNQKILGQPFIGYHKLKSIFIKNLIVGDDMLPIKEEQDW